MNSAHVLYHMVRADFLERVRRYSFLVTLAGALLIAYGVAAEKIWIVVGNGYRGVYNSAWIGVLMAICCSTFLSLAGFYIVKNSVQRDVDTRVGQVLAATAMRKDFYGMAKTLSNFAVLACMVMILMLAAVVMQLMRSESHSFSLWHLWAPFILLSLPTMLLTASLALLFEMLPGLRGGFGNVVYFFLWTAGIGLGATGTDDPSGMQLLYRSSREALQAIDPTSPQNFHFSLTIGGEQAVRTFLWDGIHWSMRVLLMRLLWISVAFLIALAASLFFHRFDPARSWRRKSSAAGKTKSPSIAPGTPAPSIVSSSASHLTPMPSKHGGSPFGRLVVSELKLMLKGLRWWWYAGAAGILIGEVVSPTPAVRGGFLVAAWMWPLLLWSQMGCREQRHSTNALLFSSERSIRRQFPAVWTAGFLVAALTGSGFALRLLLSGDLHSFAAWFAGAAFIPSLALALGVWSGSSRAFEALYTVWWYMGPAHQMPGFDFMGITPASSSPAAYAIAAGLLLAISYWGRRSRMAYV